MDQWQVEKFWLSGGVMHIRGASFDCTDVSEFAPVAGTNHIVLNGNFKADGSAVMWGTIHLANSDGAWDGSWTGKTAADGDNLIRGVAHGSGAYQGMKMFSFVTDGTNNGYILEPGAK
jgi:hypothetical protein